MKKKEKKKEEKRKSEMAEMSEKIGFGESGLSFQIIVSAVCIMLGILLLFIPQINILTLTYVLCAALVIVGLIYILSFFIEERYRNLQDYHFALGVMLMILGICGLLRAVDLATQIAFYIGLASLVLSIFILQSTVQLKVLKSNLWIAEFILTIVSVTGSVCVLADVRALLDRVEGFSYWVLLFVGIFSLVSLLLAWIGLRLIDRKEIKEKELAEKEMKRVIEEEIRQEQEKAKEAAQAQAVFDEPAPETESSEIIPPVFTESDNT